MTDYWPINLLISMAFPLCIGYLFLLCLSQGRNIRLFPGLAIAYGLGLGILSQWILVLAMAEIPFTLETIIFPLTAFSIFIWGIHKKSKISLASKSQHLFSSGHSDSSKPLSTGSKVFTALAIAYILFSLFYVFFRSLNIPIENWDALASSAFKAKVFFYDRSIHQLNLPHTSYPLQVPFIESWIALNLNRWDDILVKIIFPLIFSSYLIIHYYFLKSMTNRNWALAGVVLILSSNFVLYHATIAYREIFMMYYNCTAIILLLLWHRDKNDFLLILAALFSGFTTFVKLEGTGYLFVHTVLLASILFQDKQYSFKERLKKFFKFCIPSYLICILFHLYKINVNVSGMAGRTDLILTYEHLRRVPLILQDFVRVLFLTGNWNIIWFMLVITLIYHYRKMKTCSTSFLLFVTLMMFFGVYFSFLTFTSALIDNPTTLSRVIVHFFPLAPLLIVLLNYPDTKNIPGR